MANITQDYLDTEGYKPTAGEITKAQLVPNLADGTLWTKNSLGLVVPIGGTSSGSDTNIDGGNASSSYTANLVIDGGNA